MRSRLYAIISIPLFGILYIFTVNLEFSEEVPFHVDSELSFSKKFDVSILPGALNII
jgi:hypothetical protein